MIKGVQDEQTGAAEMLEALVIEILGAFFDLRAAGKKYGLVTEQGAGSWGLMRSLATDGPQTVPTFARSRSVSRQYIQKLANELIDEGWVRMADNPAHKRSKLMTLTRAGERQLGEMTGRLRAVMADIAPGLPAGDLEVAAKTVAALRSALPGSL